MSKTKGIYVKLSTKVDHVLLNEYMDSIKTKVEDTWDDVKVDYLSIDDYLKELIDVDYLIEVGIIEIIVE